MKGDTRISVRLCRSITITAVLLLVVAAFSSPIASAAIPCGCGEICTNETGWWHAGGDFNAATNPLSAAVGAANAGDTICVKDGTYRESVQISKNHLTLRSENGTANCIVNASGVHGFHVAPESSYVNISGFTLENATSNPWWSAGVIVEGSHCNISYNLAKNNFYGINIEGGDYNLISYNDASYNSQTGIKATDTANYNTFSNNTASHNRDGNGICLCNNSDHNTLTGNTAEHNTANGFLLQQGCDYNQLKNNNQANSNTQHGFYLYDNCDHNSFSDSTATYNAYGFYLYNNCDYNSFSENTVRHNTQDGFLLQESSCNNMLTNNIVEQNNYGMYLINSCSYNTLSGNTVRYSSQQGIALADCDHNTLTGNTASQNTHDNIHLENSHYNNLTGNKALSSTQCDGIDLGASHHNNVTNNKASSNTDRGIKIRNSTDNTVTKNTVLDNSNCGIHIENTTNSNFSCNWVQDNSNYGFGLCGGSTGNTVQHNNILTNGDAQADGSYHWQFYNCQSNAVTATNNYWGPEMNQTKIENSIYDDDENAEFGEVTFVPFNEGSNPCAPVPDLSAAVLFASGLVLAAVYFVCERKFCKMLDEQSKK